MASKSVFIREATGLVREFSFTDVWMISWNCTIIFSLFLVQPAVTLWPGVNPMLALVLMTGFAVPLGVTFGWLQMAMPRSGGDYIYDSRILHPAAGFLVGFYNVIVQIFSAGYFFLLAVTWPLAWLLTSLGLSQLSATLSQPVWSFVVGAILLIIYGLLTVFPRKYLSWFLRFTMGASFLGGATVLVILLVGIGRFPQLFEASTGVKYESIIPLAIQHGFNSGFSLPATLLAVGWLGLSSLAIGGVYIGGEAKDVKRSALWGTLYASLAAGATYVIFMAVTYLLTGYTWYNALTWLYNTGGSAYPISPGAQINNIATLIMNSPVLSVLIAFTMLCSFLTWFPLPYLIVTRITFGWAFDRLLPERYANVSEKYHTPVIPTVASGIIFLIGLAIATFFGAYASWVATGWFFLIWTVITAIAAILFPYGKMKRVFEQAPPLARAKLAGIPVVTIGGASALACLLVFIGTAIMYPSVNPMATSQAWIILGATIVGIAWYYVARYYHLKRSSFDISLVFKEIPPE